MQGDIPEYSGIVGNDLAYLAVSPGNRLEEPSLPVGQYNSQTVQLPGEKGLMVSHPFFEILNLLCFVQGKHGGFMPLLGEIA